MNTNQNQQRFDAEPTPICDSCANDGARMSETVCIPVSVGRKLEKELRIAERRVAALERELRKILAL
jgi:hypothetical protein